MEYHWYESRFHQTIQQFWSSTVGLNYLGWPSCFKPEHLFNLLCRRNLRSTENSNLRDDGLPATMVCLSHFWLHPPQSSPAYRQLQPTTSAFQGSQPLWPYQQRSHCRYIWTWLLIIEVADSGGLSSRWCELSSMSRELQAKQKHASVHIHPPAQVWAVRQEDRMLSKIAKGLKVMTLIIWQTRLEGMMGAGRLCSVTRVHLNIPRVSRSSSNKYCHERAMARIISKAKCIFTFKLRYITVALLAAKSRLQLFAFLQLHPWQTAVTTIIFSRWASEAGEEAGTDRIHRLSSLVILVLANRALSCIFECISSILISGHVTLSNRTCHG